MRFLTQLVLALAVLTDVVSAQSAVTGSDDAGYGRPIQDGAAWQRDPQPLLWNFCNMYQPCVVEFPGETYRFKMWFFGWSADDGNARWPGCDAIFHARSKDLRTWEVYAGDQGWDTAMNPKCWAPVIAASDRVYDAWHNGDPSVVYKDGRYYMAYSATSKPYAKKTKEHLDGMLCCIMGATSDDGIHWTKTAQPLLIESREVQEAETDTAHVCDFHRPSLMWDQGKWRLWFDYWCPPKGVCMGYAENVGDFGADGGFVVRHDLRQPLIINWPNPEVIRVGNRYYAFADPCGYPEKQGDPNAGWTSRALCEAVSEDGLHWKVLGYLRSDADAAACHVPQALLTTIDGKEWLYLFYATQRGGNPYDYRYDRIRAMRRPADEVAR